MNRAPTRISAVAAVAAVAAAVVTDLTISGVDEWWNRHSLVGSLVSSVLVLGVTVLIVDEVTAHRQVRERKRVAAVQALIVYGQTVQTAKVLMAPSDQRESEDAAGEVRALASMVLTAAPALFDDPEARDFMEQVEEFSSMVLRTGLSRPGHDVTDADRAKLSEAKEALSAAVQPLLARLDPREVTEVEGDIFT